MTVDAEFRNEHPNLAVVRRVGEMITSSFDEPDESLFADDFVFHYFNSRLPDLAGDYHGLDGIRGFFARLDKASGGSFHAEPVSLTPFGDELVAAHAIIRLSLDGAGLELDALLVWRVFADQVHEAWDIPAVNTVRTQSPAS